jgi:hypothetical protein
VPKSFDFKENISQITILSQWVPIGCQNIARFFFLNFKSSLTSSQIWLFPLVDNHHYGYIKKLEKIKNKTLVNMGIPYTIIYTNKKVF